MSRMVSIVSGNKSPEMVDQLWHLAEFRYELVVKLFGGRNGQSPNLQVGGKLTNYISTYL